MSKIKRLTNELQRQYRPTPNIADVQSLEDNFIASILAHSQYAQEVQGFSIIELSQWLQDKQLKSDFDLYNMLFNGGNYE